MRKPQLLVAAALLLLVGAAPPVRGEEDNAAAQGFTALLNGKDLTSWHGMKHFDPYKLKAMTAEERTRFFAVQQEDFRKHWTIEKGELVNDGFGPYATTDKEFENYELLIDYKTVAKADSGIYLRATPQVQIWDYTKEGGKWKLGADKGSGGLWNNSKNAPGKDPLVLADKPFGQWNRMRIFQIGARTTVYLNDKLVVDHAILENFWRRKEPMLRKGPIQLQTHGGEIRWRNVFIREIADEEADVILSRKNDNGFVRIFNGANLDGWAGAVANYEVVEGSIGCKKGKGGNLYTKEKYDDFIVRLEFKVPPGGNNGLAIRYPGKGNPAYAGMTELQVLDNTAKKYNEDLRRVVRTPEGIKIVKVGLDKRQYHGSAYGMAAAARGYLRKPGKWNFQEVSVRGSTIKVELNGFVILDTDLSKITKYMANSPHPGKTLKSGHFGFCGHGDAVRFRNLKIKRLKKASSE